MENTIIKLTTQLQHSENTTTCGCPPSESHIVRVTPHDVPMRRYVQISRDEYTKSSQTLETAFIPCESCHGVQKSFRDVTHMIISVCESQGLPSTLGNHMEQVSV